MKQEAVEYGLAAVMLAILISFYFIFVSPYLSELIWESEAFKAQVAAMSTEGVPKDKLRAYLNAEQNTFRALGAMWVCIQFLIIGAGVIWLTGIRRMARSSRREKDA